jgi:serine/threonine-protein kinase
MRSGLLMALLLGASPKAIPSKPYPGQFRPDARGQCPSTAHTPINGGCWLKIVARPEECIEEENPKYLPLLHLYNGGCYVPAYPLPRPAVSSLMKSR